MTPVVKPEPKSEESEVALKILSHLARNPDCRDSLEGIVEWWLLEQDIRQQTERVRRALAGLVDQGLVEEYRGPDSRQRYRINRGKLDDIVALLKSS